jgi:hypothetical protein
MPNEPQPQPIGWHVTLALTPVAFVLLKDSGVLAALLPGETRWMFENFGLLYLCVGLCVLGYWRERRLAVGTFPALGIALAQLAAGVATAPLLFPVGLGLAVVVAAAATARRILGRSWEGWLLAVLIAGCLLAPLAISPNPGPPVAQANPVLRIFALLLAMPQAILFFASVLGLFPILIGGRLAPRAGTRAGLVVMGTLYWLWDGIGDPAYALGVWTDNQALVRLMELLPAVTLLFVVLAVMLAQGRRSILLAFLLPIGAGLFVEAAVDLAVRPYATLGHSLVISLIYLVPLAIALWLCGRRHSLALLPRAMA